LRAAECGSFASANKGYKCSFDAGMRVKSCVTSGIKSYVTIFLRNVLRVISLEVKRRAA